MSGAVPVFTWRVLEKALVAAKAVAVVQCHRQCQRAKAQAVHVLAMDVVALRVRSVQVINVQHGFAGFNKRGQQVAFLPLVAGFINREVGVFDQVFNLTQIVFQ